MNLNDLNNSQDEEIDQDIQIYNNFNHNPFAYNNNNFSYGPFNNQHGIIYENKDNNFNNPSLSINNGMNNQQYGMNNHQYGINYNNGNNFNHNPIAYNNNNFSYGPFNNQHGIIYENKDNNFNNPSLSINNNNIKKNQHRINNQQYGTNKNKNDNKEYIDDMGLVETVESFIREAMKSLDANVDIYSLNKYFSENDIERKSTLFTTYMDVGADIFEKTYLNDSNVWKPNLKARFLKHLKENVPKKDPKKRIKIENKISVDSPNKKTILFKNLKGGSNIPVICCFCGDSQTLKTNNSHLAAAIHIKECAVKYINLHSKSQIPIFDKSNEGCTFVHSNKERCIKPVNTDKSFGLKALACSSNLDFCFMFCSWTHFKTERNETTRQLEQKLKEKTIELNQKGILINTTCKRNCANCNEENPAYAFYDPKLAEHTKPGEKPPTIYYCSVSCFTTKYQSTYKKMENFKERFGKKEKETESQVLEDGDEQDRNGRSPTKRPTAVKNPQKKKSLKKNQSPQKSPKKNKSPQKSPKKNKSPNKSPNKSNTN